MSVKFQKFQLLRPEDVCGAILVPFELKISFALFQQQLQDGWERIVDRDEFERVLVDRQEKKKDREAAEEEVHGVYGITQLDQTFLDHVKSVRIEAQQEMKDMPDAAQFRQALARLRNVERVEFSGGDHFYSPLLEKDRREAKQKELTKRFAFWFQFLRDVVPVIWPAVNEIGWSVSSSAEHFMHTSRALFRPCFIRLIFHGTSSEQFRSWTQICKYLASQRDSYKRFRFVLWGLPVQGMSDEGEPAPASYFRAWHKYLASWLRLAPLLKLHFGASFGEWHNSETLRLQAFLQHHRNDVRQVFIDNEGHHQEIDLRPLVRLQMCEVDEFEMGDSEPPTGIQLPSSLVALWIQHFFAPDVKPFSDYIRELETKLPHLTSTLVWDRAGTVARPELKQARELVIKQQLDTLATDALPLLGPSVLPLLPALARLVSPSLVSRAAED